MAKKNFRTLKSLKPVEAFICETREVLNDNTRTIAKIAIPAALTTAVIVGAMKLPVVRRILRAAIKWIGSIIMAVVTIVVGQVDPLPVEEIIGGVAILAIIILAVHAMRFHRKKKRLLKKAVENERFVKMALEKEHALVAALKDENDALYRQTEQITQTYQIIIMKLRADLGVA